MVAAVSWERVNLTLTVVFDVAPELRSEVEFRLVDEGRSLPVRTRWLQGDFFDLEIDVTDLRARKQVPDGSWRIVPHVDGAVAGPPASYASSQVDQLDQGSRTFVYAKNLVSSIVNLGISEDDERPDFLMRTHQMFRSARGSKPKPTSKDVVGRRVLSRAIREEDFDTRKIEAFRPENFDRVDTGASDRVIDWLILSGPRTSRAEASGTSQRDPTGGDAGVAVGVLVDQDEA